MSGDEAPRQRERWLAMTGEGHRTPRAFVPLRSTAGRRPRKDSAPCGALSFYMRVLPLQILSRLLAEHVGHIAAEDHVDLTAHGEVGGVAVGGDDDHHVMVVGGDMQMHRGAHQLTDIHGTLDAVGAEHDVIGANAQRHVLFRYIFSAEPGLLILGQFHVDAVDSHGVFAVAVLHQLRVKEVHLGRADKASHEQIGRFVLKTQNTNMEKEVLAVRAQRKKLNILPAVKRIPTVASEHPDLTNYLYMTYAVEGYDINYYKNEKSVIVLGSGAYRIGSSVEFDWCSVNAINTARKLGYKSIMINYNPETVSTDYDMCDRLYFDELSFERVLDVIDLESPRGVIVSVGGQIPNNLAMKLHRQSVPILGTSPVNIDRAENRGKFSAMLDKLGIDQPKWSALTSMEDVQKFIDEVGYPVLVRPSYVLSGAAMNVCHDDDELRRFLEAASEVSKEYPVVISQFMTETNEIEFDGVAQNGEIVEYGISEHVEYAGVHSGDATMTFPAQQISFATARQIKKISRAIAKELNISGPFNIQYLAKGRDVKVIECNLRASRSFPFVSKVLKRNFIETATRIMLDAPYQKPDKSAFDIDRMGVKASQFSFARLQNADPVLGVDMSSTGEVGCMGDTFEEALLNSLIATGYKIPSKDKGIMLSSGGAKEKASLLDAAQALVKNGYTIYATAGTAKFLNENNVKATAVGWPDEEHKDIPNVMQMIADHKFDLIVNIPKNHTKRELTNGYRIRRGAIDHNIPLITNARLASAFIEAFCTLSQDQLQIKSWQEYE